MIKRVSITNYALIAELSIDFSEGLSIITGETGAGKSILLGAIGLVLGQRADSTVLLNPSEKCICEIEFDIDGYALKTFFETNDLDYQTQTILRREIAPGGKSRAFINDTPVNLTTIREIGLQLVDVHSQHETLLAEKPGYQLSLLDSFANHNPLLESYRTGYKQYHELIAGIEHLKEQQSRLMAENDYRAFILDELTNAKLTDGEYELLETEFQSLSHAEEIQAALWNSLSAFAEGEINILSLLNEARGQLNRATKYLTTLHSFAERADSAYLEIKDLSNGLTSLHDKVGADPERLAIISDRLDHLNKLLQKHRCATISELITIRNTLEQQTTELQTGSGKIAQMEAEAAGRYGALRQMAVEIGHNRQKASITMQNGIRELLTRLGMPKAQFEIQVNPLLDLTPSGMDAIRFLFSANEGYNLRDLSSVASGGELSRFMLALKAGVADKMKLPTIIFDEIDTGVSGEIAGKVGTLLREMSCTLQVINITHLPQVAARGHHHLLVYKAAQNGTTITSIRQLTLAERQQEIARMLSGETITEAALQHAGELLAG